MKTRDELAAEILAVLSPQVATLGNHTIVDMAFNLANAFYTTLVEKTLAETPFVRSENPVSPADPRGQSDLDWAREKLEKARHEATRNRNRVILKYGKVTGVLGSDLPARRWERIVSLLEMHDLTESEK